MGYNHGLEKKKFDIEWQKNKKLYRELGMTDEQIVSIKEFDYKTFRSDRVYYEKKSDLSDYEDKWYDKFAAMEKAMSKVNAKSNALAGLFGTG